MPTLVRAMNRTRGTILCERLEKAVTSLERSRGLLGRKSLEPGAGMLFIAGRLTPFLWMHMFFMRFPIDIVFLDRSGKVLKIDHCLRPWRVSSLVFGAHQALELAAGSAAQSGARPGDQIVLEGA